MILFSVVYGAAGVIAWSTHKRYITGLWLIPVYILIGLIQASFCVRNCRRGDACYYIQRRIIRHVYMDPAMLRCRAASIQRQHQLFHDQSYYLMLALGRHCQLNFIVRRNSI